MFKKTPDSIQRECRNGGTEASTTENNDCACSTTCRCYAHDANVDRLENTCMIHVNAEFQRNCTMACINDASNGQYKNAQPTVEHTMISNTHRNTWVTLGAIQLEHAHGYFYFL